MKKPIIATAQDGTVITVGMPCFQSFNGDRYPHEVVSIESENRITIRAMEYHPDPNSKEERGMGFAENPDNFIYTSNPNGRITQCKRRFKMNRDKTARVYRWETDSTFGVYFGKACFTRNPHF